MKTTEIKSKVKELCKEFRLCDVTLTDIKAVIQKQGYTIVEFNNIYNDEHVETLIKNLNLSAYALGSKGFTYVDRNYRIVFVHEDLSDSEKLLVLSHELGHIYCDHMTSTPVIGKDVQHEYEANEFTHYLLNRKKFRRSVCGFQKKKVIAMVIAGIIAIIAAILCVSYFVNKQLYYDEYYLTNSGNKYHEKDCIFVKDKTNVRRMTKQEFESGEYEYCEICLPHDD